MQSWKFLGIWHVLLQVVVGVHFGGGAACSVEGCWWHSRLPINGVPSFSIFVQMDCGLDFAMVIIHTILLLRLLLVIVLEHHTSKSHGAVDLVVICLLQYTLYLPILLRNSITLSKIVLGWDVIVELQSIRILP